MKPNRVTRRSMFHVPCSICILLIAAAASPFPADPADLIRRANAAFLAGDVNEADRLYTAAEELTADPGLIAFNRAAVLFAKGEFREAEVLYARVLDDAACPPERAAKAWFNRGTSLLRRGGAAAVFRSAVACLERCVDSDGADAPLKADARHNLELAKLLWNDARQKETKKDTPNNNPPPEDPRNEPQLPKPAGTEKQPGGPEPNPGKDGKATPAISPQPNPGTNPTTQPNLTEQPAPGGTPAPPQLENRNTIQPLSPEDTRRHLLDTAARLRKDRRDLLRTLYGPPQPGINDW